MDIIEPFFFAFILLNFCNSRSYFLFHNLYLRDSFRGREKGTLVQVVALFKCVVNVMKSSYFFRFKIDSYMALRPGEGPRALRFALWLEWQHFFGHFS